MTRCNGCDHQWHGNRTTHCAADGCHQTFTGLEAFDKHRTGSHAAGTRHCEDPAAIGLIDAGRGYPCWQTYSEGERSFWK